MFKVRVYMQSYFIVWVFIEYKLVRGGGGWGSKLQKVVRWAINSLFSFAIHVLLPSQSLLSFLGCTKNFLGPCFASLFSSFFVLIGCTLSFLWLFQTTRRQEALLSPLSHAHGSNTKRKKSSQFSSPSHTYRSSSKKSFFQIFSSSCSQLEARVILALITPRIHV